MKVGDRIRVSLSKGNTAELVHAVATLERHHRSNGRSELWSVRVEPNEVHPEGCVMRRWIASPGPSEDGDEEKVS